MWTMLLGLLGPIGGFLKAVPWRVIAGIAAIVIAVLMWNKFINHQEEREQALLDAKIEAEQAVAHSVQVDAANKALTEANEASLRAAKASEEALKSLAIGYADIRAQEAAQKKIFAEHDLKKLTNAKPGLIENRANAASAQRMKDLSEALQ